MTGKRYRCNFPIYKVGLPTAATRIEFRNYLYPEMGMPPVTDPKLIAAIESHPNFNRAFYEFTEKAQDEEKMLERAIKIALEAAPPAPKKKKPEAIGGMMGTEGAAKPKLKEKSEPILPNIKEINLMSKAALLKVIENHNLDVDLDGMDYHDIKKAVKEEVRQLAGE